MRIAALVKQIPAFEEMELGTDGRLRREGLDLEMNPYCRRAVSQAVELAAAASDGAVTVFTLGPASADDVLREAIAWARAADVRAEGVLVTDPAFAGSDTLATARALATALEREGPFDLVLVGRSSVDADTGQVGPELAELLGLPFATGVREMTLAGSTLHLRCEHDDGWMQARVELPAVLSAAERLTDPCKVDPDGRASVEAELIRTLTAADLGPGPWGAAGSPTAVGPVRVHHVARDRAVLDGTVEDQVRAAVEMLAERGALDRAPDDDVDTARVPAGGSSDWPAVAVAVEPKRPHAARELLGASAELAASIGGYVAALTQDQLHESVLGSWGADVAIAVPPDLVEEDVARALASWAAHTRPWAILASSTAWGREVAARTAVRLGVGLTGDAVGLEVQDGRLAAWKPAFGGQLVAAITSSSPVQMATVRVGVLPSLTPRSGRARVERLDADGSARMLVIARTRDDDLDALAEATVVVGVGMGVAPDEYDALEPLLTLLGAELGATRKVTDRGWLPRARQIGITGRAISPRLYVALGVSGKFNHMVGVRAANTVLAVNHARDALVHDACDIGIVADIHDAVPLLVREIAQVRAEV